MLVGWIPSIATSSLVIDLSVRFVGRLVLKNVVVVAAAAVVVVVV